MKLPEKTIERLLKYRRLLMKYQYMDKAYIFSHDLARVFNIKAVQVRRDVMLVGYKGNNRTGYNIFDLLLLIDKHIDTIRVKKAIIVGADNLGVSTTEYFLSESSNVQIVAAFDCHASSGSKIFPEIPVYNIVKLREIVETENITVAILAVSSDDIDNILQLLLNIGITSVLNLGSIHIEVPEGIYLKELDLITEIEKLGYFSK